MGSVSKTIEKVRKMELGIDSFAAAAARTKRIRLTSGESGISKLILPHHTLHGSIRPLIVFRIRLAVIKSLNITIDDKINQLPNRHTRIDTNGHRHRNFQSPMVAKTDITLPRRRVNVDAESPCA